MFLYISTPSQRRKQINNIKYKVKQEWDSSFGAVGKLEEIWNAIYPE